MTPEEYAQNRLEGELELLRSKYEMLDDINKAFQEQNNTQQTENAQLSAQYQYLVASAGGVITIQGRRIDDLKLEVTALRGVIENKKVRILQQKTTVKEQKSIILSLQTVASKHVTDISNFRQAVRDHVAILAEKETWSKETREKAFAAARVYHDWNENNSDAPEHAVIMEMLYTLETIARG